MLKNRIISTLRFFDLRDYPLTLLELHQFLLPEMEELKSIIDGQYEIKNSSELINTAKVPIDEIFSCLENECSQEVQNEKGFYYLSNRQEIVQKRLENYLFGIKREHLIKKYAFGLRHIPFVRGVGLAGSQAMGQQKESSDIDLLIIIAPGFLWLTRILVTAYFQILGLRRYGRHIANRFCLNHYLVGPKKIQQLKNIYTAGEYLNLRAIVYPQVVYEFQNQNYGWLNAFYPNAEMLKPAPEKNSFCQRIFEKAFSNKFGQWLEKNLKKIQLLRIRKEPYILAEDDELSFHPNSKQQELLGQFFKTQQQ